MMLSSMLDVINKRIRQKKSLENFASPAKAVEEFLRIVSVAEKFSFGVIPSEKLSSDGTGWDTPHFKIPAMTEEEIGFWFDGLIPLPADVCWYEFALSNEKGFNATSGILVKKHKDGSIWSQRVEGPSNGDSSYMIDGTWSKCNRDDTVSWRNADEGRFAALSRLSSDKLNDFFGSTASITLYLTLMINSKTTDLVKVVPTNKQQSLRRQLGEDAVAVSYYGHDCSAALH